jgi:hypothetical protein
LFAAALSYSLMQAFHGQLQTCDQPLASATGPATAQSSCFTPTTGHPTL